jgi:hypothetical protein
VTLCNKPLSDEPAEAGQLLWLSSQRHNLKPRYEHIKQFFIQFCLFYYRNILTKRACITSEIHFLTIFWETPGLIRLQERGYSKFLMPSFGLFRPQSFPCQHLIYYSFNVLSFESVWPELLKLLNKSSFRLHIIILPILHTSLLALDNIAQFLILV